MRLRLVLLLVIIVHGFILFAGFLTPYSGEEQDRNFSFSPPTRVRLIRDGAISRPYVFGLKVKEGSLDTYEEDRSHAFPIKFLVRGQPYKFLGVIPANLHLLGTDEAGRIFVLGTDRYGRDVFSRFAHGGELSLLAGLLATVVTLALASLLGGAAGFFGRWIDMGVMSISDLFLTLPWLYLLLAVRAFLPLSMEPKATLLLLVSVIGVVGWAKPARLVRGVVLEARTREFVIAARSAGATEMYVLRRHVVPQTYGVLLTQATLLIPQYVLAEVTLSFVGLGIGEPAASWGTMLSELQQFHVLQSYWWMVIPACLMLPVFASYFLLASHLQSRLESPVS
jgi:peptide/nickel transport system permease protein